MDSPSFESYEQLRAENQLLRAQIRSLQVCPKTASAAERLAATPLAPWFDAANDAIFVTDANWHIQYWNEAAERIYGWPRAAVVGQPISEIIAVLRYADEGSDESALHALATTGSWRGEVIQHTRDGRELYIEGSTRALSDQSGTISGYIAINRDITERKLAEIALEQSEARFAAAFHTNPTGLLIARTSDGAAVDVNESFLRLIGYIRAEVLNDNWRLANIHIDLQNQKALREQLHREGHLINQETILRTRTGELRTVLFSAERLLIDQQECVILTCTDITERLQAQQALNAEYERLVRLKDGFMATMSHELRTPLASILGRTELLLEGIYGPLNPRQTTAVQTIAQSSQHLLALINDILDYTKFESGQDMLALAETAVAQVCRDSIRMVSQTALHKRIMLSLTMDSAVTTIVADRQRLQQILVNLLENAVKFTHDGGEVGLVVQGDMDLEQVSFTVWDTGIGIADQNLAQLFRPFTQLDSNLNRQYEGTGLGLALVRQLTDAHGGSIVVTSTLGQGSQFCVRLPWRVPDRNVTVLEDPLLASPVISTSSEANTLPNSPPPLLLLVEDSESNITLLQDTLLSQGYQLEIARDGSEALDRARLIKPALILMDIQLPRMNGIAVIQRMRADELLSKTPIIALTALAMPDDRERCLNAGANDYMTKPVSLRTLLAMIATHLKRP